MHTKRIIPCLDVKDGRVVKGVNFVDLIDAGDPVECGKAYDMAGADELVFLDITASSDKRNIVTDMVRRVAETVFIPFTVPPSRQDIVVSMHVPCLEKTSTSGITTESLAPIQGISGPNRVSSI